MSDDTAGWRQRHTGTETRTVDARSSAHSESIRPRKAGDWASRTLRPADDCYPADRGSGVLLAHELLECDDVMGAARHDVCLGPDVLVGWERSERLTKVRWGK
jgi:hypothetical protein